MSEKRFELVEAIYNEVGKQQIEIMDNLEKQILDKQKVADLLNEQQATINKLKEENEQLKSTITHLQEECGARENDYVNLKKQFHKIPKNIREVWKE